MQFHQKIIKQKACKQINKSAIYNQYINAISQKNNYQAKGHVKRQTNQQTTH